MGVEKKSFDGYPLRVEYSITERRGRKMIEAIDIMQMVGVDYMIENGMTDSYTSKAFREHMERTGYSEVVLSGLDECGCVGATAKGAVKTKVKVKMLGKCIGSRFPEKKVQNMRKQLTELGVEYL